MSAVKPRIGMLGVGWIGLHRMRALLEADCAEIAAIADPSAQLRAEAHALAPGAAQLDSLDELLRLPLDAIAIATPSALHPQQAIAALRTGRAVFCQKPLARSAEETTAVVRAAQQADRLLAVDFSYRKTRALEALKAVLDSGELGPIYSARLVFHNAYGPDKSWYYDRSLSGGGAVMDLGIHLVDSALWLLGRPQIARVNSALYNKGRRLPVGSDEVEDYAIAQLETDQGACIEITCSWNLPAGTDAVIGAELYGPSGGVAFQNVAGSFYDFVATRYRGTQREVLVEPPDAWGGRAIVAFAEQLRQSRTYHSDAQGLIEVASILDRIYGRV